MPNNFNLVNAPAPVIQQPVAQPQNLQLAIDQNKKDVVWSGMLVGITTTSAIANAGAACVSAVGHLASPNTVTPAFAFGCAGGSLALAGVSMAGVIASSIWLNRSLNEKASLRNQANVAPQPILQQPIANMMRGG